jgi:ribosomal protein S18 acetylase RimI-like enzyme
MNSNVEIVAVDATNVTEHGFFCYKSKPKSEGYRRKLEWLEQRFSEDMKIRILYEGKRSVGFIEYIPGEYAWRAVHAEGYMVIHCLWVVGKGKGKGYGSRLLNECVEDAQKAQKHGVVMVSSSKPWLADKQVFLKNGFEVVGQAPPTFELLVKRFDDAPLPTFPDDWGERLSCYGSGVTVVYSDQCPYTVDAVKGALKIAGEGGVEARTVKLESSQQVRDSAPSAYGVFNVVYDGKLVTYKYIDSKKERQEFLKLLDKHQEK